MKRYHKMTPEGTRDLLFEECSAVKEVGRRAVELFADRGYHEVMTPTIEYYDVFQNGNADILQESAYKLVDMQGRILVLRPDSTLPVARFTATRLRDAVPPIRLCYTQNVFRINRNLSGHSNEITQSGIELIGAQGLLADAEVLCMAAETLRVTSSQEFRIELGHAGIYRSLADALELDGERREELRYYIESKNDGMLGSLLDEIGDSPQTRLLRALPRMFGGTEIIEKAKAFGCRCSEEPLSYLEQVYKTLTKLSLDANIQIDLGLVHRNRYYTGLVFRGYVAGSGDAVISGGRYDNLLADFDTPLPAIGFALDNDSIAKILLAKNGTGKVRRSDVLVAALQGYEAKALRHYQSLLENGLSCEILAVESIETADEYANRRGISRLDLVGETIQTI